MSAGSSETAAATRLASLDSIRGLAALSVVICHYLIFLQGTALGREIWHWLWVPPLSLFRSAYGSVILFFVLSGYVLALSLAGERRSWLVFAIRRFFRIWPAFAIALGASFVIGEIVPVPEPVAALFDRLGATRLPESLWSLLSQLAMTTSDVSLDMPGWSLVHELRISLLFPLLLYGVRRAPLTTLSGSLCLEVAAQDGPSWLTTLIPHTAVYIVYFSIGACVAIYRRQIGEWMPAKPALRVLSFVAALVLISIPKDRPEAGVLAGLGASYIIAFVTTSPRMTTTLSRCWFEFLGRVSYSLYLTHVVILLALLRLFGSYLPAGAILAMAVPIIGLAAVSGYYLVEKPSIKFGRTVARFVSSQRRIWPAAPDISNESKLAISPDMNVFDSPQFMP